MNNPPKLTIEKQFLGKICTAIHPANVTPQDEFWVYPVRTESPNYKLNNSGNTITERRFKGLRKDWIASELKPVKLGPDDKLLVVDLVRNLDLDRSNKWAAIVLIGERTFQIGLESLWLHVQV